MAGWLHGVFVGEWLFVFPLCGFSLSLFCNYMHHGPRQKQVHANNKNVVNAYKARKCQMISQMDT